MVTTNVRQAMQKAKNACLDPGMRESKELCNYVLERLQFLESALETSVNAATEIQALFADALDLFVRFLKQFSGDKKLLQRIAASSAIRREVHALHEKINVVFIAADLTNAQQMTEWEQHEAADVHAQRLELEKVARRRNNLTSDLSGATLNEALTEIKFEIDSVKDGEQDEHITLLVRVLDAVELTGAAIPEIPDWFIRRDDVEISVLLDYGSFGAVHEGLWEGKKVCVKQLFEDGADTQKAFLKESTAWHDLSHPNIVKMHGGCHVGSPLFFVSEFATKGNFSDYFKEDEENMSSVWRLFYQAALGLAYLHKNSKVHGDLRATNILVDEDGTAKLCDFGFSHTKTLSLGSLKAQPTSVRWKAPECIFEQGRAANPTYMSDVYSLGMTIIEVKTNNNPWGMQSDEEIAKQVEDGYPRPEGFFTDSEWEIVQGMTAVKKTDRWTLDRVLVKLAELALCSSCQIRAQDSALCINCAAMTA